ncbi:hypothetical protein GKZ89_16055 [Bacillus mangrovi]|uniref:Uncharacterized protein n=1 Tax=Metabacillus mangrovi TaxID=1491830 RepID=A0A7X2S770_9BACI|nr:hypothetical protein [Metabacillus mangrovi]MTH54917.1 hypothetical protein [Metabacillus mangrovi]
MNHDLELTLMKKELERLQQDYHTCESLDLKNQVKMDIEMLNAFLAQYAEKA